MMIKVLNNNNYKSSLKPNKVNYFLNKFNNPNNLL